MLFCLSLGLTLTGCSKGDEAPANANGGANDTAKVATNTGNQAKGKAKVGGGGRPGGKNRGGGNWGGGGGESTAVPVAVENAIRGDISSYYSATATLEAEKEAQILARAAGVLNKIHCEEGDTVKRNQSMLVIEDKEYRLRLAQAEATVNNARSRHDRLKGMFENNLVSAEEYDAAKNDLESAEAEVSLAELNLSYTKVLAPFTGLVVQRLVDVGQSVSVGTPLFLLSDFNPLLARVHVPSKEFRKLKRDQRVELTLDSDDRRLSGKITLVSPVIDPQSGTIKVTVEVQDYPAGTRPGDFAEVRIVTELRENTLLVPKGSVFSDKGETVLYVAKDDQAERRVVTPGFENEAHTEIVEGIVDGEAVIVRGQRSLKDGNPIKVMEDKLLGSSKANTAAAGS
ncbi:MAG: efflux RND transporter periplasmic adaptor subunit [Candidatus Eisenbacteria bacterium]|uniref:Efflux RND transporter periplasmic adaptor subunit n=1 Tax=Eiseniibacteriota bacterium TaxID=2212470 RepID=A0A7Y2E5D7_UNCEI|nr:efflux RND transporter periplasmic adaptor subunit [Candidatus Eisenbacteria bacterium]